MALTDAQLYKISSGRKLNPPSFFNADTGETEVIGQDTEAALLLLDSSTKQKSTQYLDALISANPSRDDYDAITKRASETQRTNADNMLSELQPMVEQYESFQGSLLGGGAVDPVYATGMQPFTRSLNRGLAPILNQVTATRLQRKMNNLAAARFASKLTDTERKEWRSWKRVILAYP